MGSNVMLRKKRGLSSGINVNWKTPQLANTKGGYMLIATNKNELLKSNPDLIVIDGSNQELLIDNVNDYTDYQPSGILVLCIAKLERESVKSQYLWGHKDAENIKKWKTNIITGHSSHFGSTGNYYSFGNRANYGLIGLSSLTQCVHKKFKKKSKMKEATFNTETFEQLLAQDLKNGVQSLVSILPNVRDYIAPTLNTAYKVQSEIGDCNLKKTAVSDVGLWQSTVCVNCQTSVLHTENDCTYTVITTPNQVTNVVPIFLFEIKKGFTVGLQMDPGLTFMFSGKYLFHRQMILDQIDTTNSTFINLASYGNDKLFNHFKTTLHRVNT